MNLLNALAVADAKEMLRDAEMEMLHELFTTVAFWEKVIFISGKRSYVFLGEGHIYFWENGHIYVLLFTFEASSLLLEKSFNI